MQPPGAAPCRRTLAYAQAKRASIIVHFTFVPADKPCLHMPAGAPTALGLLAAFDSLYKDVAPVRVQLLLDHEAIMEVMPPNQPNAPTAAARGARVHLMARDGTAARPVLGAKVVIRLQIGSEITDSPWHWAWDEIVMHAVCIGPPSHEAAAMGCMHACNEVTHHVLKIHNRLKAGHRTG